MEIQILKPVNGVINLEGPILYSSSYGAWNTLRIKRDIIKEFPSLKEKQAKFSYKMILHRDYEELKKAIRKMKRNREAIPILLFLGKERINPVLQ